MPIKATIECKLKNGDVAFKAEASAYTFADAFKEAKEVSDHEFDHCFEADHWATITITLDRTE